MRHVIAVVLLAFLISACGQKGPLYLPKEDQKHRKTEEGTIEK